MDLGYRSRVRMAMLNADTSSPNTYATMGTFGDILYRVLTEAAWRVDKRLSIEHSVFDVVHGEYPRSLLDYDAVMITASAASSYHIKPWIQELEHFIVRLYKEHPDIKIFGSCFGHHIICQALLKDHGFRVEKSPNGWEIGINHIVLTDEFRKALYMPLRLSPTRGVHYGSQLRSPHTIDSDGRGARSEGPDDNTNPEVPRTVRLQFVHENQVIMPSISASLPEPWILLGYTEHCAVQGIYQPGRVMTLQGHFEFDKFESQQTERIFGADIGSATRNTSHCSFMNGNMTEEMDDGYLVAELLVRWLFEPSEKDSRMWPYQDGMLPTPRSSVEIS